ncbi:MFS transporter [Brevibacillus choshinensis]|uniref:MFS transporter n=1 Tax=Brevibacillus choshinensis TaxID=54911 RepID=UPI002E1AD9FA|nr:MFS transporter [Brevibacillus choshinensis]
MAKSVIANRGMGSSFWTLWTATAFSNLGDGIIKFLLPVLAAKTTSSPALVAGVSFMATLPWLLFSLPIGAIVDRVDRKKLITLINLLRVAAMMTLFLAAADGWLYIYVLYLFAAVLGVCETFSDTASGSLVPSVVPRDRLEQANARIFSVETIMNRFVGGPLAGFFISISISMTVLSGSFTYLMTVLVLLFLRGDFKAARTSKSSIQKDIAEGVRFLWNNQILRTLAIMVAVMSGCWSAFFSLLVLHAVAPGPLQLSDFGYSMLLTALAAGSLVGAAMVGPIQKILGRRGLLGIDIVGTITMLAVPALTSNVWLVGTAIFLGGFGGATWSVGVATIRQNLIPDELLGRVYAAYRLVGWGTLSLGAIVAGMIAEVASVPVVFLGGALINLALFIPMITVLTKENLDNEQMEAKTI